MEDSDISQLEQTLIATKQAGNAYLQATLTKFLIRWTLLLFLLLIFWIFIPFLKWGLLFFLPLFSYSLYQIHLQKRIFRQKIEAIEASIEEVKIMA